ncbi:L-lactate MFS transporter [Dethiosulfatarculus sandiegensis]|uniref:MFS transporter n=1 Tax=Dethiosulfatarculus sandiegensis TaxID=1429043 RepID=A0A0D2GFE9_9BACT|nr:OFA family MFS transporter [Dethiosulfatarculus sandiegensis]KIX13667.1 MFS transporter [Dethiosulfatarculus sandiegensis]
MTKIINKGRRVTMAGLGVNLALGILYTWSIFKLAVKESITRGDGRFEWSLSSLNDPYAVCCLVFAFSMIIAGRVQDKIGPRLTAMIGGVLTGLGLMLISQSYALWVWVLGFGVLTGAGLGFGYASATPPAIKWFPAAKTGLIAGLVVSGFGLASVYIAPLSTYLIDLYGLSTSMMIFGVGFLVAVCALAQMLINPPKGYNPEDKLNGGAQGQTSKNSDYAPGEMLKTKSFYLLWFIYFVGAGAGLMIIGNVAGMARQSLGELAWIVVALMAVGNAGGRIVAGIISDKIGRTKTLAMMLSFQGIIMFGLLFLDKGQSLALVGAATIIGFNYGANLSLFPSACKDFYGLDNFGTNYGLLFTAWGVGGFALPRLSQMIVAATGSFHTAYLTAGVLLFLGAALTWVVDRPEQVKVDWRVEPHHKAALRQRLN